MDRIDTDKYFLEIASTVAKRSTCMRRSVYGNVGTETVYLHNFDEVPSMFSTDVGNDVWVEAHDKT